MGSVEQDRSGQHVAVPQLWTRSLQPERWPQVQLPNLQTPDTHKAPEGRRNSVPVKSLIFGKGDELMALNSPADGERGPSRALPKATSVLQMWEQHQKRENK